MIYSILDVVIVGAGDFRSALTYGIPSLIPHLRPHLMHSLQTVISDDFSN